MKNNIIFSLIVATLDRYDELDKLLESLSNINFDNFEVIVVDQNQDGFLDDILFKYSNTLNLKHILSPRKGLSFNRNIGLQSACGEYVCFPDDDCTYYPNTLSAAFEFMQDYDLDFLSGRIFDRDLNCNVIKSWPNSNRSINLLNVYTLSSSVTLFAKNKHIRFDEMLGAGSPNGSCEDPDYLIQHLKNGYKGMYTPTIEVNHPIPTKESFNVTKRALYARGFGFLLRKNTILFVPYFILFHVSNIKRLLSNELSFSEVFTVLHSFWKGFFKK